MSRPHFKRPESVLVVIYTRRAEVLMLERCQPAGFWQSVTGSLQANEAAASAAAREVAQETGLQVGERLIDCAVTNRYPILPAWRARYAPGVRFNTEHVFRAELADQSVIRLNPTEHRRYQWLPKDRAMSIASSRTDRDAIGRFVPELP